MEPERVQRASMRGRTTRVVERVEAAQQVARRRERRRRRRVEPVQRARVRAPDRELERERREIGRRDLGRRVRRERALRALGPDPIADAGSGAARAAGALLGRRARDPLRLEAAHARAGIEHAAPLEARIDDGAHAVDREARLGDVGREHDLAAAAARGLKRRVLLGRRQLAVERQNVDVRAELRLAESRLHAADLGRAGQEHEQIAGRLRERAQHDARDDRVRRLLAGRARAGQRGQALADVADLDRMHARGVLDDWSAAEQPRDRGAVEGGRHREDAQRRRDVPLRIESERETDVGVEAALVELVEDHGRDAAERGVALQHPREHAFGHDLEPCLCAHARLEPHPVADGGAGPLAERRRHPRGDRARRETAWLEQHDLLRRAPMALRAARAARRCSCRRPAARRAPRCARSRARRGAAAGLRRSAGRSA